MAGAIPLWTFGERNVPTTPTRPRRTRRRGWHAKALDGRPGSPSWDMWLWENRNGLAVDVTVNQATGTAERDAAADMLEMVPGTHPITVGADNSYDTRAFAQTCRQMKVTPHVAQRCHSAIDGRTTRHPSYKLSQRARKRVEEVFGKPVLSAGEGTVGGGRKLRYRGVARNQMWAELIVVTYNLVRMAKLTLNQSRGQPPSPVVV